MDEINKKRRHDSDSSNDDDNRKYSSDRRSKKKEKRRNNSVERQDGDRRKSRNPRDDDSNYRSQRKHRSRSRDRQRSNNNYNRSYSPPRNRSRSRSHERKRSQSQEDERRKDRRYNNSNMRKSTSSERNKDHHRHSPSLESFVQDDEVLPVTNFRDDLVAAINQNKVIICIGETGSGKTTQIPQYLRDYCSKDYRGDDLIAVTQPRRVAAISVAERVASERNSKVGDEIGYQVRFEDCTSPRTRIKFMTDGTLIRECMADPLLKKYKYIMLDEAHERTINTDILFGLVKKALELRNDLRAIITSATLDEEKFSLYFNNCPVIKVPGRTFDVDIYHSKTQQVMTAEGPSNNTYVKSCVDTVLKIHRTQDYGHILCFLTGQDEIDKACKMVNEGIALQSKSIESTQPTELLAIPLYASLPLSQQKNVFRNYPSNQRKCIFCTNIAETSITVPGVMFVVDCGYVKQKAYNPSRSMESLIVVPISKTAAEQRSGRAGRTGPGQCFRMYSSACMDKMMRDTVPEIKRCNLENTVLCLKSLGVNNVIEFDYLDRPSDEQLKEALMVLYWLGALKEDGSLSSLGNTMSRFPIDPCLSRAFIQAAEEGCLQELMIICSMVSIDNIWYRRKQRNGNNNNDNNNNIETEAHASFFHPSGDYMTYLIVYRQWEQNNFSDDWLKTKFLNIRSMKSARNIQRQLATEMKKAGLLKAEKEQAKDMERAISRSLTAGYFANAASKSVNDKVFKVMPNGIMSEGNVQFAHIHPSSVFIHCKPPQYVVFQELIFTGKAFIHNVAEVDHSWLHKCRARMTEMNFDYKNLSGIKPSEEEKNKANSSNIQKKAISTSVKKNGTISNSLTKEVPNESKESRIEAARARALARKQGGK